MSRPQTGRWGAAHVRDACDRTWQLLQARQCSSHLACAAWASSHSPSPCSPTPETVPSLCLWGALRLGWTAPARGSTPNCNECGSAPQARMNHGFRASLSLSGLGSALISPVQLADPALAAISPRDGAWNYLQTEPSVYCNESVGRRAHGRGCVHTSSLLQQIF